MLREEQIGDVQSCNMDALFLFIYDRYPKRIKNIEVLRNLYDWVSISKNTHEYLSFYTNVL
jgi:hypothetical protein